MPVGDDHFLNDIVFGLGHGLEGVDVALEQGREGRPGFSGKEDGFSELVVFELASCGDGAFEEAFRGGGSGGLFTVCEGGGDLFGRSGFRGFRVWPGGYLLGEVRDY